MKPKVPPPIYLLLFGALMWLVARSPFALVVDIPFSKPATGVLMLVGAGVVASAIWQFRASSTTIDPLNPDKSSALVTHGIYRYTRNPMYVGLLLFLCAWSLSLGSLSNLVLLAAFIVTITRLQILPEEAALRKLFPGDYETYCDQVRRWF